MGRITPKQLHVVVNHAQMVGKSPQLLQLLRISLLEKLLAQPVWIEPINMTLSRMPGIEECRIVKCNSC